MWLMQGITCEGLLLLPPSAVSSHWKTYMQKYCTLSVINQGIQLSDVTSANVNQFVKLFNGEMLKNYTYIYSRCICTVTLQCGKAESILVIGCLTEPANLAPVRENTMFCYGPLVSELGGPRVHGAPQPRHRGGRCPRRAWYYLLYCKAIAS